MIRNKRKLELIDLLLIVMWWVVMVRIFLIIRVLGTFDGVDALSEAKVFTVLRTNLSAGTIGATIMGVITGILEIFVFPFSLRKKSFGGLFLIKSMIYAVTILLVAFIVGLFYYINQGHDFIFALNKLPGFFINLSFAGIFLSGLLISVGLNFVRLVTARFGPGMLAKIITGRYYHPRQEERVFMFLDLFGSTTIAEQLGHIQYSRFIQDCFSDISDITIDYRALVYQYVGDEVVLSWKIGKKFRSDLPLKLFFAYRDYLNLRKEYYIQTYGVFPVFKASVHSGVVTVAEVGVVKTEIAYHGDVLNTAARIQQKCNVFQRDLLISQDFKELLRENRDFEFDLEGELRFKGKSNTVTVFAVRKLPLKA